MKALACWLLTTAALLVFVALPARWLGKRRWLATWGRPPKSNAQLAREAYERGSPVEARVFLDAAKDDLDPYWRFAQLREEWRTAREEWRTAREEDERRLARWARETERRRRLWRPRRAPSPYSAE